MEAEIFDMPGLVEKHFALGEAFDFAERKNEAMVSRIPRNLFVLVEQEEGGGVFEIAVLALAAVGLNIAEQGERFLELAREAGGVEPESREGAMGVDDVEGQGGVLVGVGGWIGGAGEKVGLEQRDAVEAPGGVGEFMNELSLGGGGGMVFIEKLPDVLLIGSEVLGR